jgi:hypothetical protein
MAAQEAEPRIHPANVVLGTIRDNFPYLHPFVLEGGTTVSLNPDGFCFGGRRVLARTVVDSKLVLLELLGAEYSDRRLMDSVTECIDKAGLIGPAWSPAEYWAQFVATSIACSEHVLRDNVSPIWPLERRRFVAVRLIAAEALRVAKMSLSLPLSSSLRASSHLLLGMGLRRTLRSSSEALRPRLHAPPDGTEIPLPPQVRRLETVESLEELTRAEPVD